MNRGPRAPGKWKAALLAGLAKRSHFVLCWYLEEVLGRGPTLGELSSAHRAAKMLQAQGRCRTVLGRASNGWRLTVVGRPGCKELEELKSGREMLPERKKAEQEEALEE
jgi:hypothetical protein